MAGDHFTYLHGTSDRSDVGLKLDVLYAFETPPTPRSAPGSTLALRWW